MKLIKLNSEYYLLNKDSLDVKGFLYNENTKEIEPVNGTSFQCNPSNEGFAIYKVIASTEKLEGLPFISWIKSCYFNVVNEKPFTLNDMRDFAKKCCLLWNEEEKISYAELVDNEIELLDKKETWWDVEVDTELEPIPESLQEYPMSYTQKLIPKINNGFITITSIKH